MDMMDLAWAAGFFDGEGCISRKKGGKRTWRLVVQQNVRPPLEVLERLFGGTLYGPYTRQRSRDGVGQFSNPYYVWRLNTQADVLFALECMYPYLRVKGAEALIAQGSIRDD
jgi:hypothetical protein